MISHEEFRFQRHLELWKDQNRLVKRSVLLILLFGFLILFRVLIPFSGKTENIGNEIVAKEEARTSIEEKNKVIQEFKQQLESVNLTIGEHPWVEEKDRLVRTFEQLRGTGNSDQAQAEADKTIRNITGILRNDIAGPLEKVLTAHPEARTVLPEIGGKIDDLKNFTDKWEAEHIDKRWFRTLDEKNYEMERLTDELDTRMRKLSTTIFQTSEDLGKQIEKGTREIADLTNAISEANIQLNDILNRFFPDWINGIINVQQMTQVFPVILVALLLYLAWLVGSLSLHYANVARELHFEGDSGTDVAMSSIWTLADKGLRGKVFTLVIYCAIVAVVWFFFERGTIILRWWVSLPKDEPTILNPADVETVKWTGRIIFSVLVALLLFHRQLAVFKKN